MQLHHPDLWTSVLLRTLELPNEIALPGKIRYSSKLCVHRVRVNAILVDPLSLAVLAWAVLASSVGGASGKPNRRVLA